MIRRADQTLLLFTLKLPQRITPNNTEHGVEKRSTASTGANGLLPIPRPVRWQRSRRRSLRSRSCSGASSLLHSPSATHVRCIDLLAESLALPLSTTSGKWPVYSVFSGYPVAMDRAIARLAVILRGDIPRRGSPVGFVHLLQRHVEARKVPDDRTRWIDPSYHVSVLFPFGL